MGIDNVQLKMLGIKSIVHLTPKKFDQLETEGFDCIHYKIENFNKDIEEFFDLNGIVEQILTIVNEGKGPVFIFCVNGFLSGAIAIKL